MRTLFYIVAGAVFIGMFLSLVSGGRSNAAQVQYDKCMEQMRYEGETDYRTQNSRYMKEAMVAARQMKCEQPE